MWKWPITRPTRKPMASSPRSGLRARRVAATILARSASVAASNSSRLRARSSASSGLRHTTSRSPGKCALVSSSRLRSSNSDGWKGPCSCGELRDLRRAQRAHPVHARGLEHLLDARRGQHAAIAHPGQVLDAEAILELGHLRGHGGRVGGVALEHLHRDRTALGRAQQPEDDLRVIALAVARMAARGQLAAVPGQPGRGQVVQHQGRARQVLTRQAPLDGRLRVVQPVQRPVQIIGSCIGPPPARGPARSWRCRRAACGGWPAWRPARSRGPPAWPATRAAAPGAPSRTKSERPTHAQHPSTAATWPCGRVRSTVKTSSALGTATPPRSSTFRPSMTSPGRHDRLARVRLRTLPSSR